jgi:hypothetical protein
VTAHARTAALIDAVETYFIALHNCDTTLLDSVFHPAASLFDADRGDIFVDPLDNWKCDVATRPSPASAGQPPQRDIVSIDWLSERCAVVKVRLRILDQVFVDHLSFVHGADGFQIVAKVWHDATAEATGQQTPARHAEQPADW